VNRKIVRKYDIDGQDVREAILMWLRSKDMQVPQYIGNTPSCKYTHTDNGAVTIEWTEEGPVEP
jgi:hypothetical protein